MSTTSLTARWSFPVAGPPLPNGVITVAGETIAAVEPRGSRRAEIDLGDAVIIPGLVNAHTHLDLTGMHGVAPPRLPLPDWLSEVIAHRRDTPREVTLAAIDLGIKECIRTGTTLVGDIAGGGLSWDALAASGIRATVYYELSGMSEERNEEARKVIFRFRREESRESVGAPCRVGMSPHAPYSAAREMYDLWTEMVIGWGFDYPFATHLAESQEELELLAHHRGPFVPFLQRLGAWHPEQLIPGIQYLVGRGDPSAPFLFAHGNYLPLDSPVSPHSAIVYCPRTHAAFGHAPHPFRAFLARGVRVALGTDSLASNPDLDLLAEARFVRSMYPDVPGATLLRMATLAGAEALGWGDVTGSLEVGKSADLVVVPIETKEGGDPHELFLASDAPVRRVMCRGRWLV